MSEDIIKHFVGLSGLLSILTRRELVLGNPQLWDDRNDRHAMALYKKRLKLQSVRAICFARGLETNHHWRVYTNGHEGACIEFDRLKLIKLLDPSREFLHRNVDYRWAREISTDHRLLATDLPFLKRKAFQAEQEFRIVYSNRAEVSRPVKIKFELSSIKRVLLSPWMRPEVAESVVQVVKTIEGMRQKSIYQSKLIESKTWIGAANKIGKKMGQT